MNYLDWKTRIVVAGSRNFRDYALLERTLDRLTKNFTVDPLIISGTAAGADRMGEHYAERRGLECLRMPADWEQYGKKRAGYIRNVEMAKRGTHCACFWDGESPGTKHMIDIWTAQHGDRLLCVIRY